MIWLDVDSSDGIQNDLDKFNNRIVRVTGTFSRNTSGHGGVYLGGLSGISELVLSKQGRVTPDRPAELVKPDLAKR